MDNTVNTSGTKTQEETISELGYLLNKFPIGSIWLKRESDGEFCLYKVNEGIIRYNFCNIRCTRYTIKSIDGHYEYIIQDDIGLYESDDAIRVNESAVEAVEWAINKAAYNKVNEVQSMSCLLQSSDVVTVDKLTESIQESTSPLYYYYIPAKNVIRLVKINPEDFVGDGTAFNLAHLTTDVSGSKVMCIGDTLARWELSSLKHEDLYRINEYQYEQLLSLVKRDPLDEPSFMIRLEEIWKNQEQ